MTDEDANTRAMVGILAGIPTVGLFGMGMYEASRGDAVPPPSTGHLRADDRSRLAS